MSEEPNMIDLADERIHAGQTVRTSDGQKLGKVQDRTATYLMVSGGNIFWAKIYYVPVASIQGISRNAILLSVSKTDPLIQDWLTPPLPVDAVNREAPQNSNREGPARPGPETRRSVDISSETNATPAIKGNLPESPAPKKPKVRNPNLASPVETIPVAQTPVEEPDTATADSTERPAQGKPVSTRTQAVLPALENRAQPAAPANPAAEPERNATTVMSQETPVEPPKREQPSIPALSSTASASRPPANSAAVEKEIDQRIEELKRRLGISMRNAEKEDAISPVAPAQPPVRSTPQRQGPDKAAGSPQNETRSDAGNSHAHAAQIAEEAETDNFSNSRESITQWTSAQPE